MSGVRYGRLLLISYGVVLGLTWNITQSLASRNTYVLVHLFLATILGKVGLIATNRDDRSTVVMGRRHYCAAIMQAAAMRLRPSRFHQNFRQADRGMERNI